MNKSIANTTKRIVKFIRSANLKEVSLRNLVINSHFNMDDSFYSGLELLLKEDKIFFLITPVETYVLPVNKMV